MSRERQRPSRFEELCAELADCDVPETIQHDDIHMNNVYARDEHLRVLDWGLASVSHPFVSLVATFRFLENRNKLAPDDPWFGRLRDAYLEPWGGGFTEVFNLAMRGGLFAHAIASVRQRVLLAGPARDQFDEDLLCDCGGRWHGSSRSPRGARPRAQRERQAATAVPLRRG